MFLVHYLTCVGSKLYHTVVFFGREVEKVVVERGDVLAFVYNLVVEVRTSTFASVADRTNYLSTSEFLTFFYFEFMHVGIQSFVIKSVIDDDRVAVALFPSNEFDNAIASGINVGASRGCEVHALVELARAIDRVDTITKTRCHTGEVFVENWLYGRDVLEFLFVAFDKKHEVVV